MQAILLSPMAGASDCVTASPHDTHMIPLIEFYPDLQLCQRDARWMHLKTLSPHASLRLAIPTCSALSVAHNQHSCCPFLFYQVSLCQIPSRLSPRSYFPFISTYPRSLIHAEKNPLRATIILFDSFFLALAAVALGIRIVSREKQGHHLCLND